MKQIEEGSQQQPNLNDEIAIIKNPNVTLLQLSYTTLSD